MDEVDRSLRDLIDSLDLHPRYSLRRTDSRHCRLLESLDLSNPSPIMAPPTTTTPTTTTTTTTTTPTQCSQLYGITVKFCGNVPDGSGNSRGWHGGATAPPDFGHALDLPPHFFNELLKIIVASNFH